MEDFSSLFDSAAFVVNFVFSMVLLIIFLRLAWNVGKIKKHITGSSSRELEKLAEKAIFKGNTNEAVSTYLDLLYLVMTQPDLPTASMREESAPIVKRIVEIGGKIPPEAMKMIKTKLEITDLNSI